MKIYRNSHNGPLLSVLETHLEPDLLHNDVAWQVQYMFSQVKFMWDIQMCDCKLLFSNFVHLKF
jgi:hypothetical protein